MMGLDITAYSKLQPMDVDYNEDGEPIDRATGKEMWITGTRYASVYVNPDFPERADGLTNGAYSYDDELGFRAGSYSGYSEFRDALVELAGAGILQKGDPFWELVWFSDCEGTIGPVTSAKLARDFADFANSASEFLALRDSRAYENFRAAFELAADDGAVCFH